MSSNPRRLVLDDGKSDEIAVDDLIKKGKTHDFEKLPQILWSVSGVRLPNRECFERVRSARNSIQHFCTPDIQDLSFLSRDFIYTIIDPLIFDHFNMYAIECHEDHGVGYDYLVGTLLRSGLKFSVPDNFSVGEIIISDEMSNAPIEYQSWMQRELIRIGRKDLLSN